MSYTTTGLTWILTKMKITFDSGEVLKSEEKHVTLMLSKDDYEALRQAISFVALHEARLGNTAFANDMLYLNARLEDGVVSC